MNNIIYRRLQQHLDRQAIGFPEVSSGADIRILQRLFAPDEAMLAMHMSYKPEPTSIIAGSAGHEFPEDRTKDMLESMINKGAIGWKKKDGTDHWYLMPFVVGMYEAQDGDPSPEFLEDAEAYMKTMSFGKSFMSAKPSQMRTIPINRSISSEHHVADYDHIRAIVRSSEGPFVVIKCMCRQAASMRGKPCGKTARHETCLAIGNMALMVLRRKHGREISKEEVLEILSLNEADGLVLQPANYEHPDFVCSCCGCCCGMLAYQKFLPRPVDFWTSNFHSEVSSDKCSGCGTCTDRCQVKAVTLTAKEDKAEINLKRCIGCGLCVATCPSEALRLIKKNDVSVPPANEEALIEEIMSNKKGAVAQFRMLVKSTLGMKQ